MIIFATKDKLNRLVDDMVISRLVLAELVHIVTLLLSQFFSWNRTKPIYIHEIGLILIDLKLILTVLYRSRFQITG